MKRSVAKFRIFRRYDIDSDLLSLTLSLSHTPRPSCSPTPISLSHREPSQELSDPFPVASAAPILTSKFNKDLLVSSRRLDNSPVPSIPDCKFSLPRSHSSPFFLALCGDPFSTSLLHLENGTDINCESRRVKVNPFSENLRQISVKIQGESHFRSSALKRRSCSPCYSRRYSSSDRLVS